MNNERYYLLTGAAGFLGSNICLQLLEAGCKVRALVLPNDKSVKYIPEQGEVVLGDLTDAPSLEPFFTVPEGCTSVIIHCASMVTVNPNYSEKLMAVIAGGDLSLEKVSEIAEDKESAARVARIIETAKTLADGKYGIVFENCTAQGGGAVFHDLGNLNFTFLMCDEDYDLDRQFEVIRVACENLGISVEKSGRNDLLAEGKKFSGNAFYHSQGHAYHHGTLLVDADMDKLSRYLTPPKAKLEAKLAKAA